ncbi:MAG: DitJ-like protein CoA ligase, crotonobetaine/carnitine-CoA ligase [Candidatus Dadabacteria bacterium CSP1-2]|nr:MAG: DitJ-like protein CoA ligase, crotonobetaine/carnitine-CoA ligase [Candidatus Dadabacteria bacterium CSP1-2]
MRLLFKPRDSKYLGQGTLPYGTFDDTSEWLPITKCLEKGALMFPDKPMFKIADKDGNIVETYSYKETNEWANRISNGLRQRFGVKKGDKVGMYMLNCSEYVVSIIAIHKAGAVQVPINKDEKGERLAYVINYSDMVSLIIDPDSIPFIQEIVKDLTNLKTIFVTRDPKDVPESINGIQTLSFTVFNDFSSDNPGVDMTIADMERCMFTSGTTGMPKGVVRDHGGVILTVRGYLQQQGVRSGDTLMSVLSLGHANAQVMCLFSAMTAGATAVFFPRFSASSFWKWASECGATCVNMLGAIAEYLWAAPPSEWDKRHKIRIMLGSPAPRNLAEFQERFGVRVIDGYGSTEMGMVLWKDAEDHRPGSSGYSMEGYHVELRDPQDTNKALRPFWDPYENPTPPEEAKGLLYIKPLIPHTTLNEYFKDARRTREAFDDDGFFNSDDLFARGIDGRYYFVGRFSRIRVSGENVDPIAVQDVAMRYPAIQEAIAVGIRLPNVSDDEIKLNITLKPGETFDPVEFSKWMAELVMVAMVPRFIEIYPEGFPVTATQKIKMGELKEIGDRTWDRAKTGLKFSARK